MEIKHVSSRIALACLLGLPAGLYAQAQEEDSLPIFRSEVVDSDGDGWMETYDRHGQRIEESWHDPNGALQDHPLSGFARVRLSYDQGGRITEVAYFDSQDRLTEREDGVATSHTNYDAQGRPVEGFNKDAEGQLVGDMCSGIARWTQAFDDRGNVIEESYFDVQDQPAMLFEGHSRETRVYDDQGRIIEAAFFMGDEPTVNEYGYARVRIGFDADGNRVGEAYFGTDGQPMIHAYDGISRWRRSFDDKGQELEVRYFGTDGLLMVNPELEAAGVQYQYDEDGNAIETSYIGTDGQLMVHPRHGYARLVADYESGERINVAYLGADDQLMIQPDYGYARAEVILDEYGDVLTLLMFDTEGYEVGPQPPFSEQCLGTCCWCPP